MDHDNDPNQGSHDNRGGLGSGGLLWYLLAAGIGVMLIGFLFFTSHGYEISFTDLVKLIEACQKDEHGKLVQIEKPYHIIKHDDDREFRYSDIKVRRKQPGK